MVTKSKMLWYQQHAWYAIGHNYHNGSMHYNIITLCIDTMVLAIELNSVESMWQHAIKGNN